MITGGSPGHRVARDLYSAPASSTPGCAGAPGGPGGMTASRRSVQSGRALAERVPDVDVDSLVGNVTSPLQVDEVSVCLADREPALDALHLIAGCPVVQEAARPGSQPAVISRLL